MEIVKNKILIVGLGNRFAGDDGVGLSVLERLEEVPLPKNVSLLKAGVDGLDLLNHLGGVHLVILVDACDFGKKAGEWFVAEDSELSEKNGNPKFSLHQPSCSELISLAKIFYKEVRFKIVGIQPEKVLIKEGLNESVLENLSDILNAIQNLIKKEEAIQ